MPKPKTRESWDQEETRYMLRLVRERQILRALDGKRFRSNEIFETLVASMQEKGYDKTAKQMQCRFKTLRCTLQFNQWKRKLTVSGEGNVRKNFPFFEEMALLLNGRPVNVNQGIDSADIDTASPFQEGRNENTASFYDEENVDCIEAYEYIDICNVPNNDINQGQEHVSDEQITETEAPLVETRKGNTSYQGQENVNDDQTIENEASPRKGNTWYQEQGANLSDDEATENEAPQRKIRKGNTSYKQCLENFAKTTKTNAAVLQRDLLTNQKAILTSLFQQQQEFEKDMMKTMIEGQKTAMLEVSNSFLQGLKSIFHMPPSPFVSYPYATPHSTLNINPLSSPPATSSAVPNVGELNSNNSTSP